MRPEGVVCLARGARPLHRSIRGALLPLALLALGLVPRTAPAYELGDGLVELHGFYQMEYRGIADGFRMEEYHPYQWAHSLDLEAEFDLLPDGWGPIDLLQGFVRVEARYDCAFRELCHIAMGQRLWGNGANRAPSQFTNGRTSGHSGRFLNPGMPSVRVHGPGDRLVTLTEIPPLDKLLGLGGEATAEAVDRLLAPIEGDVFAVKYQAGSLAPETLPLGPWKLHDVTANGALREIATLGSPHPLPLRPDEGTHFTPSPRLRELIDHFDDDDLDVNFSQSELEWNHGASQQQVKELREAYLDMDLFDGQLFIRAGRQTTVWGKTELFRAQDQFNPQDIALATLSSLEESRIPLWSLRAIWSFWDVGPFQDVRLEFAANLDEFQPTDLGVCGEPYTPWLVCLKKFGAFSHGLFGLGLAGEERPPSPFESSRGLEAGLRLEFRWGRFSFAITDFYGFPDFPVVDNFNVYQRNVDVDTGRPRIAGSNAPCDPDGIYTAGDTTGCLTPANAAAFTSGNRQLFDLACGTTAGIAAAAFASAGLSAFESDCLLDIFNTDEDIVGIQVRSILGLALGGGPAWTGLGSFLVSTVLGGNASDFLPGVELHNGGALDGPAVPGAPTCGTGLSDAQEALLGTGSYFFPGESGDLCGLKRGIDLFHAEASVILQAFPQFDGPVATRFIPGRGLVMLPGARGPGDPGYDPAVDGCVVDLPDTPVSMGGDAGICNTLAAIGGDRIDPRTGEPFHSEMAVVSYNFMALLATLSTVLPESEGCDPSVGGMMVDQAPLLRCTLVAGIFGLAGAQRPEVSAGGNGRYGRRDFLWHGGAEARLLYKRRNVLGFATDFAEDRTKTNWGLEFVWFADDPYGDTHELDGWSRHDTLSLTVSVDRPTFVNFLNANRTIFFNAQFFIRWIDDYTDKRLTPDGPFSLLATLSAFTGFWQDRFLVALTMIHEASSNSSGLITSFSYRMTENFSVSTGLTTFRGEPRLMRMPRVPIGLSANVGGDYQSYSRRNGLTPIADREEMFVNLRYTF